ISAVATGNSATPTAYMAGMRFVVDGPEGARGIRRGQARPAHAPLASSDAFGVEVEKGRVAWRLGRWRYRQAGRRGGRRSLDQASRAGVRPASAGSRVPLPPRQWLELKGEAATGPWRS